MVAFVLSLFANKLFRYALAALAIVALIVGGVWAVKHQIAKRDEALIAAERQRVETETLKQSVAAQAAQEAIREADRAELQTQLGQINANVAKSRTVIRQGIATGAIPNGQISPAKMAVVDQIEELEAAREREEAR